MSLDAQQLVEMMKKVAVMATNEGAPFSFCIGRVVSADPLKINVEQRLTLGEKQLLLTNAVRDYEVKLTTKGDDNEPTAQTTQAVTDGHYTGTATWASVSPDTSGFMTHNHAYSGDKWFKVNLKLKVGESVLLLRIDGGQKYIVLDRVKAPKKEVI